MTAKSVTVLSAVFSSAFILAGCMGAQHSTLDAVTESFIKTQPYVEAYIEFPGPQKKWAGPPSFLLHVVARDGEGVKIIHGFGPGVAQPTSADSARVPASSGYLTTDVARTKLADLAGALEDSETGGTAAGCLSPVRVRLIRADGALTERQGCRASGGWARVASETTHYFMYASIYGETPPTIEASGTVIEPILPKRTGSGGGEIDKKTDDEKSAPIVVPNPLHPNAS